MAAPDTLVELSRVSELLDILGIAASIYEKTGCETMPRAQIPIQTSTTTGISRIRKR